MMFAEAEARAISILHTDYPAVIGHFLVGWSQWTQYANLGVQVILRDDVTKQSVAIDLYSASRMPRKRQIDFIDQMVDWARDRVSWPAVGQDKHKLFYRK